MFARQRKKFNANFFRTKNSYHEKFPDLQYRPFHLTQSAVQLKNKERYVTAGVLSCAMLGYLSTTVKEHWKFNFTEANSENHVSIEQSCSELQSKKKTDGLVASIKLNFSVLFTLYSRYLSVCTI